MIEINLHPDRERKKDRKGGLPFDLPKFEGFEGLDSLRSDPWNAAFVLTLVLVPLMVLGFWLLQRADAGELEARLDAALADSAEVAELQALSDSLRDRQEQIRTRIRQVERLDRDRYVWPRLLEEMSAALPPGVWLTRLERRTPIPDVSARLEGVAVTPLVITDFVRNLQQSPFIGEVEIVGSEQQVVEGINAQAFTLIIHYRDPPPDAVTRVPLVVEGS